MKKIKKINLIICIMLFFIENYCYIKQISEKLKNYFIFSRKEIFICKEKNIDYFVTHKKPLFLTKFDFKNKFLRNLYFKKIYLIYLNFKIIRPNMIIYAKNFDNKIIGHIECFYNGKIALGFRGNVIKEFRKQGIFKNLIFKGMDELFNNTTVEIIYFHDSAEDEQNNNKIENIYDKMGFKYTENNMMFIYRFFCYMENFYLKEYYMTRDHYNKFYKK